MFKVILLICASSLNHGECQIETAQAVLYGPDATNEVSCGLQSQAYLASTALGRDLREGEYLKITCKRTSIGKQSVG